MTEKKQQNAYPLRMSASLREAIEQSAHQKKRSVNAEIVNRLEISLILEEKLTEFMGADRARELAELTEKDLAKRIRDWVQRQIVDSAREGFTEVFVPLNQFNLEANNEHHMETVANAVRLLREAGYTVDIEGLDHMVIRF